MKTNYKTPPKPNINDRIEFQPFLQHIIPNRMNANLCRTRNYVDNKRVFKCRHSEIPLWPRKPRENGVHTKEHMVGLGGVASHAMVCAQCS